MYDPRSNLPLPGGCIPGKLGFTGISEAQVSIIDSLPPSSTVYCKTPVDRRGPCSAREIDSGEETSHQPHTRPAHVQCSHQVLFSDGKFQWKRLENLIALAREGAGGSQQDSPTAASSSRSSPPGGASTSGGGGLDLSDTVKDALRVLLLDEKLRKQVCRPHHCRSFLVPSVTH